MPWYIFGGVFFGGEVGASSPWGPVTGSGSSVVSMVIMLSVSSSPMVSMENTARQRKVREGMGYRRAHAAKTQVTLNTKERESVRRRETLQRKKAEASYSTLSRIAEVIPSEELSYLYI